MDDIITRMWQDLGGRIGGPMTLRLVLQPAMAALFAIRAGLVDARTNRPPYFWAIVHDPTHRRELIREGWKAIARIFAMAIVMDGIYQVVVLGWFYPGEALIVAFLLACVPYLLIRGPVGRLARRLQPGREAI
jgi:hypothetical protein